MICTLSQADCIEVTPTETLVIALVGIPYSPSYAALGLACGVSAQTLQCPAFVNTIERVVGETYAEQKKSTVVAGHIT